MDIPKHAQLNDLFARFVEEVPIRSTDVDIFRSVRQTAERNFAQLEQLRQIDEIQASHVDQILLGLLPHADTTNNRARNAWIHWSPAITADIRHWYEASGWTEPSDWPQITWSILETVRRCVDHSGDLATACRDFSQSSFSKGFQSGTLSPILNALNPKEFLLINNRIRAVLNYFGDTNFSQSLTDYAAANAALHALLGQIETPITGPLSLADRFDLFTTWLLVDQKFVLRAPQHWLLQVGDDAWTWRAWQEGNFVAVGWDELGDLSDVRKAEFERRRDSLITQHGGDKGSGWTKKSTNQAWTFARQLHEGDQLIICRKPSLLLGVATVIGPYYFVPETPQGHRIPVEWSDRTARTISLDKRDLKKLLIRLDASDFSAFLMAPAASASQVDASLTAEPTNDSGPAYLRFCAPLVETLREQDQGVSAAELYASVIKRVKVPKSERDQLAPSGSNRVRSQVDRARYTLAKAGVIASPKRGLWQITPAGLDVELSAEAVLELYNEVEYQRRVAESLAAESPQIRRLAEAPARYVAVTKSGTDRPPSVPSSAAQKSYLDETLVAVWVRNIERKKQAILYGPPGTGKTFIARALAEQIASMGDGFVELVQFHPAYAYEDFMQGIRPETTDGQLGDQVEGQLVYKLVPGKFLRFCSQAQTRCGPCVLIIDEINRANVARVFGELMYLLEYREQSIALAGGGEPFRIPENVRIIGTMNTADRSIALVDHALRRRFAFIALDPDFDLLRRFHEQNETGFPIQKLVALLQRLNARIGDQHYALGHSYFMREGLTEEIGDIWQMEIEPYLEEYFFDQPEEVETFRWAYVQGEL